MDLIDLRLFCNIGETQSLTLGAERSNLSLPAASVRIKNIENRVGSKLLYRSNQGVVLTGAGQIFFNRARAIVSQIDALDLALFDYAQGVRGRIRIGAHATAINQFLPPVLAKFLSTHPDVNVEMFKCPGYDIVRSVTDGAADIGIYTKTMRTDGLVSIPYRTDRLVLAVSPSHPLATRRSIRFEETLDYEFVGVQENISVYNSLMEAVGDVKKFLKVRVNVTGFDATLRLIEENIGIGLLPDVIAERAQSSLRIVHLEDAWALRQWNVCVRSVESLSGFAKDFLDLLMSEAAAEAGSSVTVKSAA